MPYKGLKGKATVPTDGLIPETRRCRNQHSMAFQTPVAYTYYVHKGSFFPQTIRDWNALLDFLISSAEDAEDYVAKFTSLVRLGTNSLITGPSEDQVSLLVKRRNDNHSPGPVIRE